MSDVTPKTQEDFKAMVTRLAKPGDVILSQMTPHKCFIGHMAAGVAGEAGELSDAIKRHVFYNKPLDMDNVVEELGDLEFYLEALRQELGITREQVLIANHRKLLSGEKPRYADGNYSDAQAQARADKEPEVDKKATLEGSGYTFTSANGVWFYKVSSNDETDAEDFNSEAFPTEESAVEAAYFRSLNPS